jgi:hypothetical protein
MSRSALAAWRCASACNAAECHPPPHHRRAIAPASSTSKSHGHQGGSPDPHRYPHDVDCSLHWRRCRTDRNHRAACLPQPDAMSRSGNRQRNDPRP